MSAIDTLRDALFGNPPSDGWKPSREGVYAAFTLITEEISLLTVGTVSYATVPDLPVATGDGASARVYDDPDPENNTFWIDNDPWAIDVDLIASIALIVQPLVDLAEAAAASASADAANVAIAKAAIDAIAAAIPPLASMVDTSILHYDGIEAASLGSGNGSFETGATVTFMVSEKHGRGGVLNSLKFDVKSLGSGVINLVRATGTSPGPYTFVAAVAGSVSGTGDRTWSGGAVERLPDEHLLVSIPTGGPSIHLLYMVGQTGYLNTGSTFTSGTKTLAPTANQIVSMQAVWDEGGEPAIEFDDFASDERASIAALTDRLTNVEAIYGRDDLLYAQSGVGAGQDVVIATITRDGPVGVKAYFATTGDAVIIHERGGAALPDTGYNMSVQNLTVDATGITIWSDGIDGFTAIDAKVGDKIRIWTPTTGGATLHRDGLATGKTMYYANRGDTVPVIGDPGNGTVGGGYDILANNEPMACAFGTKKVLDLNSADPDLPLQYLLVPILGQSNAVGVSADTIHLDIPTGAAKQWYSGALTDVTGDPIGSTADGSPWPAYAIQTYEGSDYRYAVCFVPCGVLGAGMIAAANPGTNWSATGTLRGTALTNINAAIAALNTADVSWKMGRPLWLQGESDAMGIFAATAGVTKANYKTELSTLQAWLENQLGFGVGKLPFLICRTGWETSAGVIVKQSAYAQIQAAQDELCQAGTGFVMSYRGATTFVARNMLGDFIHYGAAARIEVGRVMALTTLAECA